MGKFLSYLHKNFFDGVVWNIRRGSQDKLQGVETGYSALALIIGIGVYTLFEYRRREQLHGEAMSYLKRGQKGAKLPFRAVPCIRDGFRAYDGHTCVDRAEGLEVVQDPPGWLWGDGFMMLILVIVAAVLGITVLQRQERRHRFGQRWGYERLGKPMPVPRPKIPVLEALLDIVLGVLIASFGAVLLWMVLATPATPDMSSRNMSSLSSSRRGLR